MRLYPSDGVTVVMTSLSQFTAMLPAVHLIYPLAGCWCMMVMCMNVGMNVPSLAMHLQLFLMLTCSCVHSKSAGEAWDLNTGC